MNRLRNILVQVDTRRDESSLLERAVELARDQQAALKLVDIVPEFSWPVRWAAKDLNSIRAAVIKQKEEVLQKLVESSNCSGIELSTKVLCGKSSDQIISEVLRYQHDLVLKDAKGQFSHHPGMFGTTAMRLVRYCPCPVWAFRPRRSSGQDRILVAIDAASTDEAHVVLNHQLLKWSQVISGGRPVEVVSVWSVYGESLIRDYMKKDEFNALVTDAEREARARLGQLLEPFQMAPDGPGVHLVRGEPAHELPRFVNSGGYDVLVLGTVARTGVTGLLIGNTAETLLNRVECSVVAVKPEGFQTPLAISG